MGRKKQKYGVIGKTPDGKMVFGGAHFFTSTYGYPLVELLYDLKDNNMVVLWTEYYSDCVRSGMKSERVVNRIQSAVREVYGSEYCDEVMDRLKFYIEHIDCF